MQRETTESFALQSSLKMQASTIPSTTRHTSRPQEQPVSGAQSLSDRTTLQTSCTDLYFNPGISKPWANTHLRLRPPSMPHGWYFTGNNTEIVIEQPKVMPQVCIPETPLLARLLRPPTTAPSRALLRRAPVLRLEHHMQTPPQGWTEAQGQSEHPKLHCGELCLVNMSWGGN